MITGRAADLIRDVPEVAARLYLGAAAKEDPNGVAIELDGETAVVSSHVYNVAQKIAKILAIAPRKIECASHVLKLRHEAVDHLNDMMYSGAEDLPRILFMPAGQMASAYYRAYIPADTMTDRGLALAHYTERLDISKAVRYQTLWIQLVASPILRRIAALAQKNGVRIVYDVDDRWDASIGENNPAAGLYAGDHGEDVWKMIELADMVTVTTEPLADFVRSRAKDVMVIPNQVPASIWPNTASPDPKVKRILWAGSPTHKRDLAIVAPALREILVENEGAVRFVCFGENVPEDLMPVRTLVDLMPFVSFEDYYLALAGVGADLAIAPLEANEFNDAKSAVKFLEYSACGYHTLMSPVGEYRTIDFDHKSLVADAEWKDALAAHLAHPDLARKAGAAARAWVKENRCIIQSKAQPWLGAVRQPAPASA